MAAKENEMEIEFFSRCFIPLAEERALLEKASSASPGASAHHSYPSLESVL